MHIDLTSSSPLITPDDSPCCATCEEEEGGRKGVYLLSTNTSDCPTILLVDDCVLELSENRTDILNLLKSYNPALVISACMVSWCWLKGSSCRPLCCTLSFHLKPMLSTILIYSPLLSLIDLEDGIGDRLWEEALVVEGDKCIGGGPNGRWGGVVEMIDCSDCYRQRMCTQGAESDHNWNCEGRAVIDRGR